MRRGFTNLEGREISEAASVIWLGSGSGSSTDPGLDSSVDSLTLIYQS